MTAKPVVKVERIHFIEGEGVTKAFVDLLILDTFIVKGLRVVKGAKDTFVSMPNTQGKDGKWYETFYPVNKQIRSGLQELVLEAYNGEEVTKEGE